MKELGLQNLLRYAFAGGIAVASFLLMYPNLICPTALCSFHIDGAEGVTLILGLVLIAGTVIYNVHRALVFPIFYRITGLLTLPYACALSLLNPWRPAERELEVDNWRWSHDKNARRRWDEWGAQTHFLYCAAWAIPAAWLAGKFLISTSCRAEHGLFFLFLFAVTLLAGWVNNYRLLYTINVEMKRGSDVSATKG
jgi:hypothetical protein